MRWFFFLDILAFPDFPLVWRETVVMKHLSASEWISMRSLLSILLSVRREVLAQFQLLFRHAPASPMLASQWAACSSHNLAQTKFINVLNYSLTHLTLDCHAMPPNSWFGVHFAIMSTYQTCKVCAMLSVFGCILMFCNFAHFQAGLSTKV